MKISKKILLLIFLLYAVHSYSQQSWLKIATASTQNLWRCSFVDTLTGWAIGDSGTIVHTSDGGLTWDLQDSKLKEYMVAVNFVNKRIGWAIAWGLDVNYFGTYILKTTNGGITWDTSRYVEPDIYVRTIFFLDSLTGYMGGGPEILFKTTNAGFSWFKCNLDTSNVASRFPINRFRFFNNDFGIACGGIMDIAGVIWKTTNAGEYWTSTTIAPEPISDVKIFDTTNIIAIGGDFEFGASINRTSNGGANWVYKTMEYFGLPNTLSFRTNSEGWCSMGYLQKFLVTYDAGAVWYQTDTPDSLGIFDIQFLTNRVGFGVGLKGAIIKFNFESVNVGNNPSVPGRFVLFQNYPNPFNPVTNIDYSIPEISEVELKVYNILGEEIATLYKGLKNNGKYSVKFNGKNLPSGIYFYRINARNLKTGNIFTESKKMIIIK